MCTLTWIFAVVLGSRKDLMVFHSILNPEPALMMNMRFKVCQEAKNSHQITIIMSLPRKSYCFCESKTKNNLWGWPKQLKGLILNIHFSFYFPFWHIWAAKLFLCSELFAFFMAWVLSYSHFLFDWQLHEAPTVESAPQLPQPSFVPEKVQF